MDNIRLTSHNFDSGGLRNSLRYKHGFEHVDLNRAGEILSDAVAHVEHKFDTKRGMGAEHVDAAIEHLKQSNTDWGKLSDSKKSRIETALRDHFGT